MRAIDADTTVHILVYDDEHEEHHTEEMTIAEILDSFTDEGCPQPQEIIRCKDCREFRRYINTDTTFCDRTEVEVKSDDFCSYAERSEQDGDL